MDFRVLGSIEACEQDRTVALGGPRQRRLLAVLLADAGHVVSLDRLVEAVWSGDAPPDAAARTTRTYVSRLRSALGDGHIVTREPGYLIDLDGASVDMRTFEELVDDARAAEGDTALARYDDALRMWRGQAFAEFAEEWWARPEASRLEELRLVALGERIDVLLALDRHVEVVPDLERLTAANPHRERFTAQLMVALHRSGREVDAHRTYHRFRTTLAEETGLDPSPELVQLDRDIASGAAAVGTADQRRLRGYVVGDVLGHGAFGTVYQAVQPGLGREVALKVIGAERADDATFVRRFETEAQLVARLEHPHIVPLYDFWREPGGAFLAFRLLRGGTAADLLVRDGPWLLDRADRFVEEVGSALVAAHGAGVVHCDVKPSNVLFDETGNAYLSDFGIAQLDLGSGDAALAAAGSLLYASPEHAHDHRPTPQSDQYSFAVTMWELLTGEVPFGGPPPGDPLDAKLTIGLPSLHARRPDLPEGVDVVVRTAGAVRPEDRFPTMAELLLAWRQAVGTPAAARTTGDPALAATPRRVAARTLAQLELAAVNPYKGLQAFREADRIDFHGRSQLVDELAARSAGNRFVTVVGPSGSGKSSLVHAGLVPRLRDAGTLVASMVPGRKPLDELSIALSRVATGAAPIAPAQLATPGGIDRALRAVAPDGGEVVLVVDQLEELWTAGDRTERELLLDGLAHAVAEPHSTLRVVTTVRADFFDRPLEDGAIGALVAAGTCGVTPMAADEILDAITAPAGRVGVTFEPGLAAALVADVAGRPAALPLLQFALTELFDGRSGTEVRLDAYRALGGVAGAITRRADEVYGSLDATQREAAHELFTRLVVIGDQGNHTRRRVRLGELAHVPAEVIAVFGDHRLLAFDRDPATREPTVEVAHEALLVSWPRLRAWLDDDRQWIALRRHLADASESWVAGGREPGELYRGARLATVLDAVDRDQPVLTARERELLDASIAARDADIAQQKRTTRRLRRLLVAAAAALVLALVGGFTALVQRQSATDNAARAEATSYRAETGRLLATARSLDTQDTSIAALLALEAGRRGADQVELTSTLQQILSSRPSWLGSFPTVGEYAFGLDGATFVARTGNGVEVYDLADRSLRARVDHPAVRGISGRRVATAADGLLVETGGDQLVHRYRLPDLAPAGEPIVTPGSVAALAMSADGVLVTGHPGGLVVVWDAATGQERHRLQVDDDITRLDISADGRKIASLTATAAQIWDAGSGEPVAAPIPADASDVALAPDGRLMAVLQRPAGVVYDAEDGHQVAELASHGDYLRFADARRVVLSGARISVDDAETGAELMSEATACGCDLAISPDGQTAATGLDGPGLYALDGREVLADVVDAPSMAAAAAYSSLGLSTDGRTMSTASFRGGTTILRRDGDDWRPAMTTSETQFGMAQPDGRVLLADTATGTAKIVDPASGAASPPFPGPSARNWPQYARLSNAGRYEVFGSFDGIVTVVDTSSGQQVARLDDLRQLNAGNDFPASSIVLGASFSNDDRWLVAAAWSGTAVAWDTTTWTRAAVLAPNIADVNGAVTPVFDRTGRYLAVSRGRTSIDLFDATTLAPLRSIATGVQGLPYHAAFDPTGTTLAVVMDTVGVLTYDVESGEPRWAALPGDISTAAVFLDPTTLAVAQPASGRLLVWHLDAARLQAEACRTAGRNLSPAEWRRIGPADEPYRRTCPQFGEPPDDPTLSVEQPPATIQAPSG